MNKSNRDNFNKSVKLTLAQRAGYLCSNPACRKLTVKPHTDPGKATILGVAAHIHAASPGGPRYLKHQTIDERKSINNAIWLCNEDSVLIDRDEKLYTSALLREWKEKHEDFIRQEAKLLTLPEISIETIRGLSLDILESSVLTSEDSIQYRQHIVNITNTNNQDFYHFNSRVQFPERIIKAKVVNSPIGVNIDLRPETNQSFGIATGSGKVEVMGGPSLKSVWNLNVDKVPALHSIEIHFLTIPNSNSWGDDYPFGESDSYQDFIIGNLLQDYYKEYLPREFLTILNFDADTRKVSSQPNEEYSGQKSLLVRNEFI